MEKLKIKKQLVSFYIDNVPSKEALEKEHPPETLATYQFSGSPTSVIVFIKPTSHQRTYTFTLTKTRDNYTNGLITAVDEHLDLYGIIDEQGQWIIKPSYHRLDHVVDDYYNVYDGRNAKDVGSVYLLDRVTNTLTRQPFNIMDYDLHQNRYVIINKDPSNNVVKGLVDVKTHEIVLPLKYHTIDIDDQFISTSKYSRKHNSANHREVYLRRNNKLIMSGDFNDLIVDGNNIIVNTEARQTKKLKA